MRGRGGDRQTDRQTCKKRANEWFIELGQLSMSKRERERGGGGKGEG